MQKMEQCHTVGTIILVILSIIFLVSIAVKSCSASGGDNPCDGVTLDSLRKHLKLPDTTKTVQQRAVGPICETIIQQSGQHVAIFGTAEFAVVGQLFVGQQSISALEIEGLAKKVFAGAVDTANTLTAIHHTPTGGEAPKQTLYMFTDPLCPYCKQALIDLPRLATEYNVDIKIIFFSTHPPASDHKAIAAVCSDFTLAQYADPSWSALQDVSDNQCDKGKMLIEKSRGFAQSLGINGVPAFFFKDGTQVVGANIPALEYYLKNGVTSPPPPSISRR